MTKKIRNPNTPKGKINGYVSALSGRHPRHPGHAIPDWNALDVCQGCLGTITRLK